MEAVIPIVHRRMHLTDANRVIAVELVAKPDTLER